MKKNSVVISVSPEFKNMIKIEAKSKGMTVTKFTEKIVEQDDKIAEIMKGWDKKYKKTNCKRKGFDFL